MSEVARAENRPIAFSRIQRQGEQSSRTAGGAQDVGGPNIATAHSTNIHALLQSDEEVSKGNRSQKVGQNDAKNSSPLMSHGTEVPVDRGLPLTSRSRLRARACFRKPSARTQPFVGVFMKLSSQISFRRTMSRAA